MVSSTVLVEGLSLSTVCGVSFWTIACSGFSGVDGISAGGAVFSLAFCCGGMGGSCGSSSLTMGVVVFLKKRRLRVVHLRLPSISTWY